MRVLHTSDWHLGRHLHGRKRYEEFERFLDWLTIFIKEQKVDSLLISGDIFDSNNPSQRALELYYRFLSGLVGSNCESIIIIGGNHDSPLLLNAPRELLHFFNIHVIGSISENPEDEIIVLKNKDEMVELIVCAIPFLRDRDIRTSEMMEKIEDKERKLIHGIKVHYQSICDLAEGKRKALSYPVPLIAMGHLFTVGGQVQEDDGVRDLYVGALAQVNHRIFPEYLDYVALGHLHIAQKVNHSEIIRYSGSPLPMGFGEAKQKKSMCLLEINSGKIDIEPVEIPIFQKLESIKGDRERIEKRLRALVLETDRILVEVIYTGKEAFNDLRQVVGDLVSGSEVEVVRVKNMLVFDRISQRVVENETLEELSKEEVFKRCMCSNHISAEEQEKLLITFQEALSLLEDNEMTGEMR